MGRTRAPRPEREDVFVVRYRLWPRRLCYAGCTVLGGSAGVLVLVGVILVLPSWVPQAWRSFGGGLGGTLAMIVVVPVVVGGLLLAPLVVWSCGERPGNPVHGRRVFVLDVNGVWACRGRRRVVLLPWRDEHGEPYLRHAVALSERPGEHPEVDGPAPLLLPWERLTFSTGTGAREHRPGEVLPVPLDGVTATLPEIVAEARRRCPWLEFNDERAPAPPGPRGTVLRRRRR